MQPGIPYRILEFFCQQAFRPSGDQHLFPGRDPLYPREHALRSHRPELPGNPGQGKDLGSLGGKKNAKGRALRVVQGKGPFWDQGLDASRGFDTLPERTVVPGDDPVVGLVVGFQRSPQVARQGSPRAIIVGRPEAPGEHEQVDLPDPTPQGFQDRFFLVR